VAVTGRQSPDCCLETRTQEQAARCATQQLGTPRRLLHKSVSKSLGTAREVCAVVSAVCSWRETRATRSTGGNRTEASHLGEKTRIKGNRSAATSEWKIKSLKQIRESCKHVQVNEKRVLRCECWGLYSSLRGLRYSIKSRGLACFPTFRQTAFPSSSTVKTSMKLNPSI
jgi:hypothetical protein